MTDHANLRSILAPGSGTVIPGAPDPLVAKLAEQTGFQVIYISGAVISTSTYGVPDIGLVTMDEMAARSGQVARATTLPAIADADTGYGNALNVMRTIERYEREGIAGVQLEDQEFPKRCGHVQGKQIIDAEEMAGKIRAAVTTRSTPDLYIVARTDARSTFGFDEAVRRGNLYLEAGADAIFPEALESEEEFARFADAFAGAPLIANMTEFGKTPLIPAASFAAMGYAGVIFPVTVMRAMLSVARSLLKDLFETGTQQGWMDQMLTRRELYDLVDYPQWIEHEAQFVPEGGTPPLDS